MTDPTARRKAYLPFLAAIWAMDRSGRGAGGQTITYHTCPVCHQGFASGSTAGGLLCPECAKTLRELLVAAKRDEAADEARDKFDEEPAKTP